MRYKEFNYTLIWFRWYWEEIDRGEPDVKYLLLSDTDEPEYLTPHKRIKTASNS